MNSKAPRITATGIRIRGLLCVYDVPQTTLNMIDEALNDRQDEVDRLLAEARGEKMNSLDLLTQLKLAVSNAIYCEATPEYRHLVVAAELERIEAICDQLLEERLKNETAL